MTTQHRVEILTATGTVLKRQDAEDVYARAISDLATTQVVEQGTYTRYPATGQASLRFRFWAANSAEAEAAALRCSRTLAVPADVTSLR